MNQAAARRSAATRVYELVRRELLEGTISPGERIRDAEVRAALGVSRTPVREAMLALEQEGLVRIVARQGYFATELSLSDVVDAYQLRYVLEPLVTAMAAIRAADEDVLHLRELAAVQLAGADDEVARVIQANKDFHLKLAEIAGNPRLVRILAEVLDALGRLALFDLRYWRTPETWRDEHLAITEAIAARDPVRAAAVVRATFESDEGLLLRRTRQEIAELLGQINRAEDSPAAQPRQKEE